MKYSSEQNIFQLLKKREFVISFDQSFKEVIKNPQYHVQSQQFRYNLIVAGTRSGDIYFINLIDETVNKDVADDNRYDYDNKVILFFETLDT